MQIQVYFILNRINENNQPVSLTSLLQGHETSNK